MAVFTPKRFSGPAFLTTTLTAVYTVGSGKTGVLKQIILNNTSTSAATVTANVVPNGAAAGTSNQIITNLSIAGRSQVIWAGDIPLEAGASVRLVSGTSNVVTATVTGLEIS